MTENESVTKLPKGALAAVVVSALGYFVDVYDLLLFSIVRVKSLTDLGLSEEELLNSGVYLLNMQMIGMLVGGILWGGLGDKQGRLSVLFGSICMYSVANIANAYVQSIDSYAVWRFIAGVGLAGELGAGITLVSESLPQRSRGIGTSIVASVGVVGAVVAALVGEYLPWRTCYLIGGVLGLSLLVLRVSVYESMLFKRGAEQSQIRGNFFALFYPWDRLRRYLCAIFTGFSLWYVIAILITFSPEVGKALGMLEQPVAGKAIMWNYIGLVVGDLASGLYSQLVKSRKRAIGLFLGMSVLGVCYLLTRQAPTLNHYYGICTFLGFSVGYWAVYVTTASEQFGTNLRATVTTTVPNFIRGSVVPVTWAFQMLKPEFGIVHAAMLIGLFTFAVSFFSLWGLEESFSKDLDFTE